jgi:hypothetical protein
MDKLYEEIGRTVVGYVRRRYATEIRAAAALGLATVAIGAYLAIREGDEEE